MFNTPIKHENMFRENSSDKAIDFPPTLRLKQVLIFFQSKLKEISIQVTCVVRPQAVLTHSLIYLINPSQVFKPG